MGRFRLVFAMIAFWALVGVLAGAQKGAMFAAVVGFILMFFMAMGAIATWDDTNSPTPRTRVFGFIIFWASLPLALLLWGAGGLSAGGALKLVFWFGATAVVVRCLAYLGYLADKKWGTG